MKPGAVITIERIANGFLVSYRDDVTTGTRSCVDAEERDAMLAAYLRGEPWPWLPKESAT